jgi:sugar/nucleoside kinase (ribokinase family)
VSGEPSRRLGVIGTFVWDRIEHPLEGDAEGWGGIAYSLAALSASLPGGWEAVPLVKVGADLAEAAGAFLQALPGIAPGDGLLTVPEPNNRVHLRYRDAHRREERLSGGVPAWSWAELEPRLAEVDALYLNLISGFELGLDTALRLRSAVAGPVYADLHSLFLGDPLGAPRRPRRPDRAEEWVAAFDVVQVNEEELDLLADGEEASRTAARVARRTRLLVVTRGPAGALVVGPRAVPPAGSWNDGGPRSGGGGARHVPVPGGAAAGDPTGCGDVWGATLVAGLLPGGDVDAAVRRAHAAARRKLGHRGAEGLREHLLSAR